MEQQLSPSEQLTYSTVRIESIVSEDNISTGTGFFFRFLEDGESHVPTIVTNKHVIKNAKKGRFYLTIADDDGNPKHV